MNIADRKCMAEIMTQFSKFNGNEFIVTSVDVKNDFIVSLLDGYELEDQNKNRFTPVMIQDEIDDNGSLKFLDRIHEIQVLNLGYVLIEKDKKKYHMYVGCSIKTYPGETGICFLNFNDHSGVHIKGIPVNEILTVDYNEDSNSIVVTFKSGKPAFRYSWDTK